MRRYKGIKYVTLGQHHKMEDKAILERRQEVYQLAKQKYPERWKDCKTGNWEWIDTATLKPTKIDNKIDIENKNLDQEKEKGRLTAIE